MAQLKSTNVVGNLSATGNILASKIIKLGGTSTQILMADGSTMNAPSAGLGTVTSVSVTSSSLTVTGSPITSSGTITIEHPTATATTADIYKIGKDNKGHVVIGDKITPADLGLSKVYKYKGTKTWAELLALTKAEIGDVYSITNKDPDGNTNADWACCKVVSAACTTSNYSTYWQSLGGKVDLSGYTEGATSSTDNAIVRFDGTSGKKIQNSTITVDDNGTITPTNTATTAANALGTSSNIWKDVHLGRLQLYSVKGAGTSYISFWNSDMKSWYEYMAAYNAATPNGKTTIAFGDVTSYARRSMVEPNAGYGWIWEGAANGGAPVGKMALSSNTGNLKVAGSVTANGFKHSDTTKGNNSYVLLAGGDAKPLSEFVTSDGTKVTSDKVYMSKNLTYTAAIGVLSKPSGGSGTIECKGKTLDQFLSSILAKREQPKVTQPSISIKFTNTTLKYEIGTKVTPTYSITKSAGSYTYGPATGVTFSNIKATLTGSANKTAESGSFDKIQLTGTISCSVSASHSAGATPVDNLGDTATVSAIASKTSISNTSSNSFTVYRKTFFGAHAAQISSFTAAAIRGLSQSSTSTLSDGSSFTITIPSGAKQVVFAYPATLRDVTSVKDVNGMNAEVKTAFTKLSTNVSVPGAESYDPIAYKVYYTNFASGANANSYKVTI